MSSGAVGVEAVEASKVAIPAPGEKDFIEEKQAHDLKGSARASDSDEALDDALVGPNGEQYPTKEELQTLRRTHGHVPFLLYTIAFVELCERFAYYGTTQVCEYRAVSQRVQDDPTNSESQ